MQQKAKIIPKRKVYCLKCKNFMKASLVTGADVEPSMINGRGNFFYQCPVCKGYVGCHKNANSRTEPLGVIPSEQVRLARGRVYNAICIVAKHHDCKVAVVYKKLAQKMGRRMTIANIRSGDEALKILNTLDFIYQEKQE